MCRREAAAADSDPAAGAIVAAASASLTRDAMMDPDTIAEKRARRRGRGEQGQREVTNSSKRAVVSVAPAAAPAGSADRK
jgi:hypothetical protein